jgi:hypothetical protein
MLKPKKYLILGEKCPARTVHCSNCAACIVQIAFCLGRGRGKSFVGLREEDPRHQIPGTCRKPQREGTLHLAQSCPEKLFPASEELLFVRFFRRWRATAVRHVGTDPSWGRMVESRFDCLKYRLTSLRMRRNARESSSRDDYL